MIDSSVPGGVPRVMTENDTSPEDSALRPAGSDLRPADHPDDLTANTRGGRPDDESAPPDDPVDRPLPGDRLPGDGTVDPGEQPHEADALRTAEYGREAEAARADTADGTAHPTPTPAD